MIPLTKQGAPFRGIRNIKSIADLADDASAIAKKTLDGLPAAGPATAAINTAATGSKGGRFKNWIVQKAKPFATATAVNTAAGGLPVYQVTQTLRKLLAGKGMRFTNDRIASLENAIANAKDYERVPLISKLQRYKSLNELTRRHYNKQSYPGIWLGTVASVPIAYAANKGWDWLNWSALNDNQRSVLTAQGEHPTTFGEDINNVLSRAESYYNGIKSLPEMYRTAAKRRPLFQDINKNNPFMYTDKANTQLREQEFNAVMRSRPSGFNSDSQNFYGDSSYQAPIHLPVDTNYDASMLDPSLGSPYDQARQIPTHSTGITMRQ